MGSLSPEFAPASAPGWRDQFPLSPLCITRLRGGCPVHLAHATIRWVRPSSVRVFLVQLRIQHVLPPGCQDLGVVVVLWGRHVLGFDNGLKQPLLLPLHHGLKATPGLDHLCHRGSVLHLLLRQHILQRLEHTGRQKLSEQRGTHG